MERPKFEKKTAIREVTGEIVYLDEMRHRNEVPKGYDDLPDDIQQMFEDEADMHRQFGSHPEIMDEYEKHEKSASDTEMSCIALADELLALKDEKSRLTFVDIVAKEPRDVVLSKLQSIRFGQLLADDDEQLAIESDGAYYPVLDIKKQDLRLNGVGVRVWGWDDEKYVFTNQPGDDYEYPRNCLVYPSTEKSIRRQLELIFSYTHSATTVTESVSLTLNGRGGTDVSRQIWMSAYAETGYEGHDGAGLDSCSDEDVAAFADLLAEIVGDEPESIEMYQDRQYSDLLASCGEKTRAELEKLRAKTHTGQVVYMANSRTNKDEASSLVSMLRRGVSDEVTAEAAQRLNGRWDSYMRGDR